MRSRSFATMVLFVTVTFGCGSGVPAEFKGNGDYSTAQCQTTIEVCIDGKDLGNKCQTWGAPELMDYSAGCTSTSACQTGESCRAYADVQCEQRGCRVVGPTQLIRCVTASCGTSAPPPPSGYARPSAGQNVPDDPTAPYRVLSFAFTASSVDSAPTRTVAIPRGLGEPVGVDLSGWLGVVTNAPDTFIGYDIGQPNATYAIPPQALQYTPTSLALADAPSLRGNAVIGSVRGVSLYDIRPDRAERTANLDLDRVNAIDTAPLFDRTNTVAAIGMSRASIAAFGSRPEVRTHDLASPEIDLTSDDDNVWVLSGEAGTGQLSRLASPSAQLLGEASLASYPLAIGGGVMLQNSIPGAIVVLLSTNTTPRLELYLAGNVAGPATALDLVDFADATPVSMKVVSIGDVQHAWISFRGNDTNRVALFNLATGQHMTDFDVDLGALDPVSLASGMPSGDSDSMSGSQMGFLHVLVHTN